MSSAPLKESVLARLMVFAGVFVLPVMAWVDYTQGNRFSATVEAIAAVTLIALTFSVHPLGVRRTIRLTLILMCILALFGSVEKLDATHNFAWLTVMPLLYIAIGGIRLGGVLTATHFIFIAASYYWLRPDVIGTVGVGSWIQVGLAYLTAVGLALAYEHNQRRLRQRLRSLAEHDSLTELLNRRGMEKRLEQLANFLKRQELVVTLALLDIDHFKRVNDQHGHDMGDQVLTAFGATLKRVFRSSDYLARWGGDEFLVALPQTAIGEAAAVLDRLRTEIAKPTAENLPIITLSIGAVEWHPGVKLGSTLKQADMALYQAKEGGRDELVLLSADPRPEPAAKPKVQVLQRA